MTLSKCYCLDKVHDSFIAILKSQLLAFSLNRAAQGLVVFVMG